MMNIESATPADRAGSARTTGDISIPTRPRGVVSDLVARTLTQAPTTQDVELSTRPPGMTVTTTGGTTHAAQMEALEASIVGRLANITPPKVRNAAHMLQFVNIMRAYDPNAPKEQRARILNNALPHFIQAYFPNLAAADAPLEIAGRILNMHNWWPDANNVAVTTLIYILGVIVAVTPEPVADPAHPPTVPPSKFPAVAKDALALGMLLGTLLVNAKIGQRNIQPALTMQRAIRTMTPAKSGAAVKTDEARADMRTAKGRTQRALANPAAEGLEGLQTARDGAVTARDYYDAERGALDARDALYVPENRYKAIRAAVIMLTSLGLIWSGNTDVMKFIGVMAMTQAILYPITNALNVVQGGPERDRRLRDGPLKVEFSLDGAQHAQRLGASGPATSVPADDPIWDWGRGIYKSQLQTRLEMMQIRVDEKIDNALHGMSVYLPGLADPPGTPNGKSSHANLLDLHKLEVMTDAGATLKPAEVARMGVLRQRLDTSAAEVAFKGGRTDDAYARARDAYVGWNRDRALTQHVIDAAANDAPSEAWRQLSEPAKRIFDQHLAPDLNLGVIKTYIDFMFKGKNSSNEVTQMAHEVADVVRRDVRKYRPDFHLKFNRSFAVGTAGGSLGALTKGYTAALVKSSTGAELNKYANVGMTLALFGVYYWEIQNQGYPVNMTITMKKENDAAKPSRHDSIGNLNSLRKESWRLCKGMFVVWVNNAKSIKGGRERAALVGDILRLNTEIGRIRTLVAAQNAAAQANPQDGAQA